MTAATSSDTFDFLGARARVLSDGLVEVIDAPPGDMPPLHVHHREDEGFYVTAGEVTLHMPEGRSVTLRAGDYFLAPRGVPHVYRVSDDGPASWLCNSLPAGFERFVIGVGELEQQDPESVARIAAAHGIEILGPPGTMP